MIKSVIFDIGNVLVDFDWEGHMRRICPHLNEKDFEEINVAAWGNNRWDRFDLGEDAQSVINDIIAHAPKYEKEIKSIFENFKGCFRRLESSISWIQDLKRRGYKVYYLSNYSEIAMETNPECLDFVPLMDGGIFSCYVHVIKPDKRIYELLCEKYDLVPEECVFIDDLERNVEGARKYGMKAIQLVSVRQAQEDLNKLLQEENRNA